MGTFVTSHDTSGVIQSVQHGPEGVLPGAPASHTHHPVPDTWMGPMFQGTGSVYKRNTVGDLLKDDVVIIGNVSEGTLEVGTGNLVIDVASDILAAATRHSPLTTYNGFRYLAYINENTGLSIAKVAVGGGAVTTQIIYDAPMDPDNHGQASLIIDSSGFIHVVFNMHNSPKQQTSSANPRFYRNAWQYWVSNSPEDIGSGVAENGWTFRGSRLDTPNRSIQGAMITYPQFAKARNNGMSFVTFRDQLHDGSIGGNNHMKASMNRYDTTLNGGLGSWEAIGAEVAWNGAATHASPWDALTNPLALFHSNTSTIPGGFYQPGQPRMFFDKNDRLHISCTWSDADGKGSGQHNYLFYMYSDNHSTANVADILWKNAAGQPLTLPITPLNSPSAIVLGPEYFSDLGVYAEWTSRPCIDNEGNPWIVFEQNEPDTRRWIRYKAGAWETSIAVVGARPWITINDLGVMTYGNGNTLRRSQSLSTPMSPNDFTSFATTPDMSNNSVVDAVYQDLSNKLAIVVRTDPPGVRMKVYEF